jgi:hypothetical protein
MKRRRKLHWLLWLGAVVLPGMAGDRISQDHWLADFEQLKAALAAGYPNFEWAAQRGMDLAALEKRAREQLAAAEDEESARAALTQFLSRFGDGHMSLTWPTVGRASNEPELPACARLGYPDWPDSRAIARDLPGYEALPGLRSPVSAGTVTVAGRRLGVLRIAVFMPDAAMCAAAIRELRLDAAKSCDEVCSDRISRRTDAMLVESIEQAVRALVATRPDAILVDVASNGGGNDSAIAAARMLTAQPLKAPRMQFVRGERRAADLLSDAQTLRATLRRSKGREKALLTGLVAKLDAAAVEAARPCDLSPLWRNARVSCTNLLTGVYFAGGLIDEELPDDIRNREWSGLVSGTARYRYTPALWTGALWVLVDGGSGSATELFAAMLQDAGRAQVIGAPSVGSGCGWTMPRQEIVLTHSNGRLVMPDCARVRGDGTNELDGIQPDVLIGFRRFDTPLQKARRLEAALRRWLTS